jgi:hypothetical protein
MNTKKLAKPGADRSLKVGEKLSADNLSALLSALVSKPVIVPPTHDERALASKNKKRASDRRANQKRIAKDRAAKRKNIAILDMETDPFDNQSPDAINPFLAVLYCEEHGPVVIWQEDREKFDEQVCAAIEALPGKYTIYAHNGGKFDFMFLIHKLRGKVDFKGRGIMTAQIGQHDLRDSYHIIPEKLASMQKQKFDYANLRRDKRHKFKKQIIDYCISDCENLLYYIKKFLDEYGFKISIGAAALAKLSENYKIEKIGEKTDDGLRRFFFGGRVECAQGAGHWKTPKRLYDINSAYPNAMARQRHPIGNEYIYRSGAPNENTAFIRLTCNNRGALMARLDSGEVTTRKPSGEFFTTKWEYDAALELGLISNVEIIECVDCFQFTTFDKFVTPLYEQRAIEKAKLDTLEKGSEVWNETNARQMFLKLILNNAYGKTAQNPRKFREYWITDPGERVAGDDGSWDVDYFAPDYWIWKRPAPEMRFLNVGTGASITGAVRAKLMLALANAVNPIYCDTDSIICDELKNEELHKTELGAWDIERHISEIIICGKKLYAYRAGDHEYIKSKGAAGLKWDDMRAMLSGAELETVNFGPTLTRQGGSGYIKRRIKMTANAVMQTEADQCHFSI